MALSKYNALKRQELDVKANQRAAQTQSNREEAKLNVIMDEDPDMARLYREAYGDVKADKESEYNEAARIHDKYAYLYDGKSQSKIKESSKYNLNEEKPNLEDEILTTELSDEGLDLIYKRYKLMQWENADALRDLDEEAVELVTQFNAGTATNAAGDRRMRSPAELENTLGLMLNKKN